MAIPIFLVLLLLIVSLITATAFQQQPLTFRRQGGLHHRYNVVKNQHASAAVAPLPMATISQQEAEKAIQTVVQVLRKDKTAQKELGKLTKVENILGFGAPQREQIAVRFNASFQKQAGGFTGGGNKKNGSGGGRGTMVGQVKASVDPKTGKVIECSVFRDLGYGRAFNLRT